jgi:putative ABC transport system permease protein
VTHLRSAARSLVRERGFTASVVLTLMLGLGGCLAVFSVIRGVLLAPLPFPAPERLTRVWMTNPQQGFDKDVISFPQFRDWRDQSRDVFDAMAVINDSVASLSGTGPAQEIALSQVSEEFFQVLGANPLFGRALVPEDYEPGRHRVVVLGHSLWTSSFGADSSIVGRTITLATEPFTVVGVMPSRIVYPSDTMAWAPLAATPALRQTMESRGALWLEVIARMKPNAGAATAQAAMDVVQSRYNAAYPTATPGTGIYVAPLHQDMVEPVARSLWLLQGAVLAVLLIACANISNLMLARATARQRDVATRIALGAAWQRIGQECFAEALLIASIGAAFGLALAVALVRMLPSFAPAQVPMIDGVSIDWMVGIAAVVLTVTTAIVVGLAPIVQGRRIDVNAAIKEGGRVAYEGGGSGRVRLALVVGQIAAALVLLVGAGLLAKSFAHVLAVPTGFTGDPVLTARVSLPAARYPTQENRRAIFWNELTRRVAELPGVKSTGAVSTVLLATLPVSAPMIPEGRPDLRQAVLTTPVAIDSVQASYFDTVGQPLLYGRFFSDQIDTATGPPAAIVNETLARIYFNSADVVGRRVTFSGAIGPQTTWLTIVGVVRDVRRAFAGPHVDPRAEVYRPYGQRQTPTMVLTAKASGDALALAGAIREIARAMDADVPLSRVQTLDTLLGNRVGDRRFVMSLLMAFAVLAVLLAAIGIYGVITYTVSRRLPEFGVCLALGAQQRDIAKMVLGQGVAVATAGTAIGVGGALFLTRFVGPQLYDVKPNDPWVFTAVAALLLAIATTAAWLPARRASRVDPMIVLRRE